MFTSEFFQTFDILIRSVPSRIRTWISDDLSNFKDSLNHSATMAISNLVMFIRSSRLASKKIWKSYQDIYSILVTKNIVKINPVLKYEIAQKEKFYSLSLTIFSIKLRSGVDFINCSGPYAELSATKKLLKSWA